MLRQHVLTLISVKIIHEKNPKGFIKHYLGFKRGKKTFKEVGCDVHIPLVTSCQDLIFNYQRNRQKAQGHTADTSENTYNFRISGNTAQSFNMGVYEEIFFFLHFSVDKVFRKKYELYKLYGCRISFLTVRRSEWRGAFSIFVNILSFFPHIQICSVFSDSIISYINEFL